MKILTESEYANEHSDFRGTWTTERTDQADWEDVRHKYMGKRTLLDYDNGTCLLVEGLSLLIVPDAKVDYGTLTETDKETYVWSMECVPPKYNGEGRFINGEEYCLRCQIAGCPEGDKSKKVYRCFWNVEDRYLVGYFTPDDFMNVTASQLNEALTAK